MSQNAMHCKLLSALINLDYRTILVMANDLKSISTKGFWWKRFFYSDTGADHDYELGPNWFASVMGTGIVANAAASLPVFSEKLHGFALVIWCLAPLMLIGLVIATSTFLFRQKNAWKRHFQDPMMAQFYRAPPMAALTVAGGTLLLGHRSPSVRMGHILYYMGLLAAWR
ncbi:MAG TPA: hypothetical protein VEM40_12085 [Nitrospirota bacterium]|nr:hypothetical protein [Nitrospirota bacterium]